MSRASLALVVWLALSGAAAAHTRSASYSSWALDAEGARVGLRIPLVELSRLGLHPAYDVGRDGRAARYLEEHLSLSRGGERCASASPLEGRADARGWAHFEWRVACAAGGPATITSEILLLEAPHLHFARVDAPGGPLERLLTASEPSWTLASAGAAPSTRAGTSLAGYVGLGVTHILSGWDHLAFLLALLLLARRLGEVASLVTAFTLAHSVTLALAVLDLVRPETGAVEALIGFSIALVGAENAWLLGGRGHAVPVAASATLLALAVLAAWGMGTVSPATLVGLALFSAAHFALLDRVARPARLRAALAFAFGLAHGFGFAGVLADLALPTERIVPALFGFNAGVELGQLAIVCAVWPLLRQIERTSPLRWHRALVESGSAAVCGLGVYALVTRALGA